MTDVFIGTGTHELRVFTGSAEKAREFAAALVLPADLEIRIEDYPDLQQMTSRIAGAIDIEHPNATIAIADICELHGETKRLRATIARAERLRDVWLTYTPGDALHHAGLMLAEYLSGEAFMAPETTPDAPTGGED